MEKIFVCTIPDNSKFAEGMAAEDSKLQKTIAQLNNNDADNKEVTIDMITKTYWQSNGFELIDPIHIEELIERLRRK